MKNNKFFFITALSFMTLTSCSGSVDHKVTLPVDEDQDEISYELNESKAKEFQTIYSNDDFTFSFKEELDVLQIHDLRNNYIWKTGIDMEQMATDYCALNTKRGSEREKCYADHSTLEGQMVDTYIAYANSLLTVEIFSQNASGYSYASYGSSLKGVSSKLYQVRGKNNHFKFVVDYTNCEEKNLDIQLKADLIFDDQGYSLKVIDNNITGKDSKLIKNILITPFLGSSGGILAQYTEEDGDYVEREKEIINGYILVPDGSGALIYNKNNDIENLTAYAGSVYGIDPSQKVSAEDYQKDIMTLKNPKLPVFGATYTEFNAGFVAYAKRGGEYLNINMTPDNSQRLQYNFVYPAFNYNFEFTQIYNQAGASYSKIADERNHFTFEMKYDFLANENANYVGMAKCYRNYLIETGNLTPIETKEGDIPMRLDFIMAETEKSLIGNSEVVVTTIDEVKDILTDVHQNLNVTNAVVNLSGWQSGGLGVSKPSEANFTSSIGTANEFKNLISSMKEYQYDISLKEDYYMANNYQMAYLNNAAKHINGYYDRYAKYPAEFIQEYAYIRPDRSYEYMVKQNDLLIKKIGDYTLSVDGISSGLVSHSNKIDRETAKVYIEDAFNYVANKGVKINAYEPNAYLWKYVDRYFNADVFDSSLLIEDETVPFLQLILNNTMELYSSYCNFSFFDLSAVLRMVDYNIYPSFMVTNDSAYYLLTTNSSIYYSTQYSENKNLIQSVYENVNKALKQVSGAEWINRTIEDNVVTNIYDNGKKVVINYNTTPVTIGKTTIAGMSYEVM